MNEKIHLKGSMEVPIALISYILFSFFTLNASMAQNPAISNAKRITGVIKDRNGISITGANIIIKELRIGTVTDVDGNFSLKIPLGAKTLKIPWSHPIRIYSM